MNFQIELPSNQSNCSNNYHPPLKPHEEKVHVILNSPFSIFKINTRRANIGHNYLWTWYTFFFVIHLVWTDDRHEETIPFFKGKYANSFFQLKIPLLFFLQQWIQVTKNFSFWFKFHLLNLLSLVFNVFEWLHREKKSSNLVAKDFLTLVPPQIQSSTLPQQQVSSFWTVSHFVWLLSWLYGLTFCLGSNRRCIWKWKVKRAAIL